MDKTALQPGQWSRGYQKHIGSNPYLDTGMTTAGGAGVAAMTSDKQAFIRGYLHKKAATPPPASAPAPAPAFRPPPPKAQVLAQDQPGVAKAQARMKQNLELRNMAVNRPAWKEEEKAPPTSISYADLSRAGWTYPSYRHMQARMTDVQNRAAAQGVQTPQDFASFDKKRPVVIDRNPENYGSYNPETHDTRLQRNTRGAGHQRETLRHELGHGTDRELATLSRLAPQYRERIQAETEVFDPDYDDILSWYTQQQDKTMPLQAQANKRIQQSASAGSPVGSYMLGSDERLARTLPLVHKSVKDGAPIRSEGQAMDVLLKALQSPGMYPEDTQQWLKAVRQMAPGVRQKYLQDTAKQLPYMVSTDNPALGDGMNKVAFQPGQWSRGYQKHIGSNPYLDTGMTTAGGAGVGRYGSQLAAYLMFNKILAAGLPAAERDAAWKSLNDDGTIDLIKNVGTGLGGAMGLAYGANKHLRRGGFRNPGATAEERGGQARHRATEPRYTSRLQMYNPGRNTMVKGAAVIQDPFTKERVPLSHSMDLINADPFLSLGQKDVTTALMTEAEGGTSGMFSGRDLMQTAVHAGVGMGTGYLFGRAVSNIMSLPDPHKKNLSRAGAIGGAIINTGIFEDLLR